MTKGNFCFVVFLLIGAGLLLGSVISVGDAEYLFHEWRVVCLISAMLVLLGALSIRDRSRKIDLFGIQLTRPIALFVFFTIPFGAWLFWGLHGVNWMQTLLNGTASPPSLGEVGDIFGGINALFAVYAFSAVALAAYYQNSSLQIAKAQQAQQSFEPLFFHLLERHRTIKLEGFKRLAKTKEDEEGDEENDENLDRLATLDEVTGDLTGMWAGSPEVAALSSLDQTERPNAAWKMYESFYNDHEAILGPYFRSLYHIFKLIDQSGLPKARRIQYANIARATLSKPELHALLINCGTSIGNEFRPLIEAYGLLKHARAFARLTDPNKHGGRKYKEGYALPAELARHVYLRSAFLESAERESYWSSEPQFRPANMT